MLIQVNILSIRESFLIHIMHNTTLVFQGSYSIYFKTITFGAEIAFHIYTDPRDLGILAHF